MVEGIEKLHRHQNHQILPDESIMEDIACLVWTKFGLQMTAATSSDLTSSSSIASAIDFVGQLDLILSRSSLQAKFSLNSSFQQRQK